MNERRLDFISEWIGAEVFNPGASVLEIGAGTGYLISELAGRFPGLRFWGLEPIADYVAFAQSRCSAPNVRFVRDVAERVDLALPIPFDVVLSNDVLHHVDRLDVVAKALARVASPACRWLAIEPNPYNPYTFIRQGLRDGEQNFRPGEFRRVALEAGWRVQKENFLFVIPPFVKRTPLWARTLERRIEWVPFLAGGICTELSFSPARAFRP